MPSNSYGKRPKELKRRCTQCCSRTNNSSCTSVCWQVKRRKMSEWSLTIRLSNGERFVVNVPAVDCTVSACKSAIQSLKPDLGASRQRLVYKGRILDDGNRPLSDYGVVDQATVFLVMSGAGPSPASGSTGSSAATSHSSTAAPSTANTSASYARSSNPTTHNTSSSNNPNPFAMSQQPPNPFANAFGMPGAGAMGQGNSPFPSPDQMREMMNSPMMQGLMDNPAMMQQVMQMSMQSNPQLRQLLDQNPELRHALEDPQQLRNMAQMMRNPELMQQAMRQQELAMSQLENMPGGFSALSSMYRNIQEPFMEAQDNAAGGGASTNAASQTQSSGEGATGAAMPNPWGSSASTPRASAPRTNQTSSTSSAVPPTSQFPPATSNPWAANAGAFGFPPVTPGGGMQPPNMEQMMQLLDNPVMMNMMQQMVEQNPDMIRTALEAQNPMLRTMFQNNPEQGNQFVRQMMNPQTLRSMIQLQQSLGGSMPGGGSFPPIPTPPANAPGGLDFSSILQGGTGTSSSPNPSTNPGAGVAPPMDFSALFRQMQQGSIPFGFPPSTQQHQQQLPADRYRMQLQSLRDMGFDDEQACLAALQQNHGNLNRAVDQLLMAPPTVSVPPAPAPSAQPPAPATSQPPPPADDAPPKGSDDKKND